MSSVMSLVGGDKTFLTNYFFGMLIIILYAKDKFNTPTYDKESMGPFSQLPPQLLTIDARYRQGMRTYVFLLLALYTALCIIGPSTFSQQNIQLGFGASASQIWPVASATFLISTGAAKDSSILGRIEHFIRQYAQKTAYIPSVVSNLAYSIRNVETIPWLKDNKDKLKPDEFEDRKAKLTALIGPKFVAKLNENPRQQGHLAAWARANIVFYCMQQMFRGVLPSERLSQIVEMPENVAIFERLKKEREELERRFIGSEEERERRSEPGDEASLDKLLSDVQRFAKEVSLTIVVLLSQSVRTLSDLKERLEQLGFREIELRDHSDHLVYLVMVNFSIAFGAFMSYALFSFINSLAALTPPFVGWIESLFVVSKPESSNAFSMISHVSELLIVATGALIYMIVFKAIDYLREGQLDLSEWRENLQGYVTVVVTASLSSAVVCILLMVLLLSPLDLLSYIWTDPAGLAQQFLFQLAVAALAAGFAVTYLRYAVKLHWRNDGHKGWPRIILQEVFFFRDLPDCVKLIHAGLAACLVGMLTHTDIVHNRNNMIDATKSSVEQAIQGFNQAQGWLGPPAVATETSKQQPEATIEAPKRQTVATAESLSRQPVIAPTEAPAKQQPRLQPKELIEIYCKLRDMYAAIHGFEVGDRSFQLSPEFTRVESDGTPDCKALTAEDRTIDRQMKQLKDICGTLNRVVMPNAFPMSPANSAPQPEAIHSQRRGPRMIVQTLFKVPERCDPETVDSQDPDEKDLISLGKSLFGLFLNLDNFKNFSAGEGSHAVVFFPMITAFLIAYTFGTGCRIWRAWWLNNEAGQQEMDKLKEQIGNIYGQPVRPAEFEQWLISPLSVLNSVAPKEAVRYEGLKARLYAKIESKQIDFGNVVAASGH
jgi:hypothetical protein